jgi:NAD(P)H dehydrogenase (quinone)
MPNPTILITSAAGTTGFPAALQLLEHGYPVRAFVRRDSARTQRLAAAGAEVCIGNLADFTDLTQALQGVQRAYFCAPWGPDMLHHGVLFALAAQEARLEVVVNMSQWLADPFHPSPATRASWMTDHILAGLRSAGVVTVNPGFFADNYMYLLPFIAQFGVMPLPLGAGLNAPVSNEDIARVIVGVLRDPAPHLGKTYRPTGPRLLSPQDIADAFASALGRRVKAINVPAWTAPKALRTIGLDRFQQAQVIHYLAEYRRNAFGLGAPTNVVSWIGGREPETFDVIIRRYIATRPEARRTFGAWMGALGDSLRLLVTPGLDLDKLNRAWAPATRSRLVEESPLWRSTHGVS